MNKYVPPKGAEAKACLRIVHGQRFDPITGKPIAEPYMQTFTKSEYTIFKNSYERLGYTIVEELYNPFK